MLSTINHVLWYEMWESSLLVKYCSGVLQNDAISIYIFFVGQEVKPGMQFQTTRTSEKLDLREVL